MLKVKIINCVDFKKCMINGKIKDYVIVRIMWFFLVLCYKNLLFIFENFCIW